MKKTMSCVLLIIMLLFLWGCSQSKDAASGEAPAESAGDLNAAREAYAALSEEDKLLFCEEIVAEYESNKAAKFAELAASICGQWRTENPMYNGSDSVFAKYLVLNEDMTYEYGRQRGTWYIDEEEEQIRFINDEDGVCYFQWRILEEDGLVKLLCEEQYCYVRKDEYRDNLKRKYEVVTLAMAPDYFGEPKCVGTLATHMFFGPDEELCVLDSLAYEKGLVYVGHTSPFEIILEQKLKDGRTITQSIWSPFEYLKYYDGAETVSMRVESGLVYFARAEYVKEVVIDEEGYRTVFMNNGDIFYDYTPLWQDFPELPYEEFQY